MDYQEKFNLWLQNVKDKNLKKELEKMTEDEKHLAFFKDLEFGTAGMRGVIGVGSNCLNKINVARVTQAVCLYMKKNNKTKMAISFDSRNMSEEFAKTVASVCAKNGIEVFLTKTLMPTPFLSYMVRFYKTDMGVMITASHNPKEYNGYKLYDSTGCQLLEEPSNEITEIVKTVDLFENYEIDFSKAVKQKLIKFADDKILNAYLDDVSKCANGSFDNLKVVYTALHGTGMQTLPEALKRFKTNVFFNKKQCVPDKNFSTCPYPNPEKEEVFESSIEIAKKKNADLIFASDPDADRIGIMVLDDGGYKKLTGNEVGVLLADFLLAKRKNGGEIVKSVVTTNLVQKVAEKYGARVTNVLTGFKYIGNFVNNLENKRDFVLGFEESYGYLIGTAVREKDATVAALAISEMASDLKKKNKTLISKLNEIYAEFGCYQNETVSYKFPGVSGAKKMQEILDGMRKKKIKKLAGFDVLSIVDYEKGIFDLPKANVLEFMLDGGNEIIVRPSGTEPLIKVYYTVSKTKEENEKTLKILKAEIEKIMK